MEQLVVVFVIVLAVSFAIIKFLYREIDKEYKNNLWIVFGTGLVSTGLFWVFRFEGPILPYVLVYLALLALVCVYVAIWAHKQSLNKYSNWRK